MDTDSRAFNKEEKIGMELRFLYEKHGFSRYKMSKFEEYDLYAQNKDFLISGNVITFTEANGKLMALKPDVTLSIVSSGKDIPGEVQKVYYNENVYRVSESTHTFREIMQVGLECIGAIDEFCIAETIMLAAESLRLVSDSCALLISHLGIISSLLDSAAFVGESYSRALRFIGEKNAHELAALCDAENVPSSVRDALCSMIRLHGSSSEVLPELRKLNCSSDAIAQLERLDALLKAAGLEEIVRYDFSLVSNMRYYNGLVFKGFVNGVPVSVLSGGQYDRLMERMHRSSKAIGFAVYLDNIEHISENNRKYDVDTVLLYEDGADPEALYRASRYFRESGNVLTVKKVPDKLRYRTLASFNGKEAVILESNA